MTQFIYKGNPPDFAELTNLVSRSTIAFAVGTRLIDNKPNIVGTGFALEYSGFYATCWHVAQVHDELLKLTPKQLHKQGIKDNTLQIAISDGEKWVWRKAEAGAWFRQYDQEADICIYQMTNIATQVLLLTSEVKFGEDVGIIGFPLGNRLQGDTIRPIVLKSIISGFFEPSNRKQARKLIIGTTVAGGFSGSPVFSAKTGRVVGMISSIPLETNREYTWPSGLSLAVIPGDLKLVMLSLADTTAKVIQRLMIEQEQRVKTIPKK